MTAKQIRVPFEGRDIVLNLPKEWRIKATLKPNPMPRLNDISAALIHELENPIGCKALGSVNLSDKKIAIVVDDISRPTPTHLFFAYLLKYLLDHGARKENILIIVALGVHRDMTQDEMEKKLGSEKIEGFRWINHNYRNINGHIELGRTKRGTVVRLNKNLKDKDLILCVGLIEPHPLLGFGGGLKMILPGLAHEETIAQNHMQGVTPERFNYIGVAESPMRLDLEEAVGMLNKEIFIIDVILNQNLEICRFVCGDPIRAHREGIKAVESINAKRIEAPADVAIVASNPMNADLRQGLRCIANVEGSIKEDGLILALLECKHKIGDIALPAKSPTFSYGLLRLVLKLLGRKRILQFIDRVKKDAGIEERFLLHFSMQIARKNRIFIYSEKLPPGTDKKLGFFRQFTDLDEMLKTAERFAPREAGVYLYPYGGVTYPVT